MVLFDSGDGVTVQASEEGNRFLLVSGKHALVRCELAVFKP